MILACDRTREYGDGREQGIMGLGQTDASLHPGLLRGAPAGLLCPQYYVWLPCLDVFQDTSSLLAASTESYKNVNSQETAICQPFPQSHWQINSSICCLVQGCWMGSWGEPWIKATIKIIQLIRSPVPLFSLVPKTAKQSFGSFFFTSVDTLGLKTVGENMKMCGQEQPYQSDPYQH